MGGPGSYLSGEEERKHVLEVIESGYLSRYGTTENMAFKQKVHTFERRFAEHVGAKARFGGELRYERHYGLSGGDRCPTGR